MSKQILFAAMNETNQMFHSFVIVEGANDTKRDEAVGSDIAFAFEKAEENKVVDVKEHDHPGLSRKDFVFCFANNVDNLLFRTQMWRNEIPYSTTGISENTEIRVKYDN